MGMVHASRIAEQAGIDQVVFQDHVAMGENTDQYPFAEFPLPPEAPWLEPMVLMSAVAAATETLQVRANMRPIYEKGGSNLAKTLDMAEQLVAAGATLLEIYPIHFATSPESLAAVIEQVAGLKS